MTVAPDLAHAPPRHPHDGVASHGLPPLRWWAPAAVFAVAAAVLSVVVIAYGTNNGPLDDPNQAFQRDGALHNGRLLPARFGGVAFGGSNVVVLFLRQQPPTQAIASWTADVTRDGTQLFVAVAGQPGTPALRDAVGMRTPNDGGQPVGYAIVDEDRRVRYATLDPSYLDHASEVELLTADLTGHAS